MKLKKVSKKKIFKKPVQEDKTENKKFSSLEEVVDKTRPFSIFYSGVESETYFKGCYDMGVRNFLMSYHYLKSRDITSKYKDSGISLFIDSGAFTYTSDPKYNSYTVEQWEKQIQSYLRWAEKHKDAIFAIANLDLEYLVGGETVQEWNEKYFEPFMLNTGIPVCFVHHGEDSKLSWEQYCKRYPYTGISCGGLDTKTNLSHCLEILKVAEKYNTVVHGMAMTQTSLLPKLPFYTVDSTSWKAGFRYGQLAVWNGKKVQMFKSEDWESKVLKYTRRYDIDPPLDEKLLYDYYEPEVLRANVYAYQRAEEFIIEAHKPLTYWFRPKLQKRDEKWLDTLEYPTVSWLENGENNNDWKEWAEKFNVSTETVTIGVNCVTDITCFMNWDNQEYGEFIKGMYNDELLNTLHIDYVNKITDSKEEKIKDLQKFFKECLLGENDRLLLIGTNFDRIVKERDSYIEDDEYEMVDISPMELQNTMSKYLPLKEDGTAPEVDELDDEIFAEHDIVPVRDEHGRFLKGQRSVLKPKKVYSKKFPKLACDTCFNAQKCPEYKAGYACAYNKLFDKFDTRDMGDIIQAMQGIVDFSLGRLQRGMLTEILSGGMPDPVVSGLMNQTMGYLNNLKQMYEYGNSEVLKQTKIIREDGSQETTTQITNPQQGGILEKIFGGMKENEDSKDEDAIDSNLNETL